MKYDLVCPFCGTAPVMINPDLAFLECRSCGRLWNDPRFLDLEHLDVCQPPEVYVEAFCFHLLHSRGGRGPAFWHDPREHLAHYAADCLANSRRGAKRFQAWVELGDELVSGLLAMQERDRQAYLALPAEDLVDAEDACPHCGERRQDYLLWDEFSVSLTCQSCDEVYDPAGDAWYR